MVVSWFCFRWARGLEDCLRITFQRLQPEIRAKMCPTTCVAHQNDSSRKVLYGSSMIVFTVRILFFERHTHNVNQCHTQKYARQACRQPVLCIKTIYIYTVYNWYNQIVAYMVASWKEKLLAIAMRQDIWRDENAWEGVETSSLLRTPQNFWIHSFCSTAMLLLCYWNLSCWIPSSGPNLMSWRYCTEKLYVSSALKFAGSGLQALQTFA
jgi:hypothetical protein